jgi:N6-adenosine-specific RNA methylase IME4
MRYKTIVMDPPWHEVGGGRIKRGADRHYPLIKTPDMPAVIFGSGVFEPAEDCHLYMWATANHLPDAIWLMGALGFKYKSNVVWAKGGPKGLGQYFRMQHEHLLFGVRGKGYNVRTELKTLGSLIVADRGRHSQKPDAAFKLIEQRSQGPYLEMFARSERDGWVSFGNEIEQPNNIDLQLKELIDKAKTHVVRQQIHGKHEQDRADAVAWLALLDETDIGGQD